MCVCVCVCAFESGVHACVCVQFSLNQTHTHTQPPITHIIYNHAHTPERYTDYTTLLCNILQPCMVIETPVWQIDFDQNASLYHQCMITLVCMVNRIEAYCWPVLLFRDPPCMAIRDLRSSPKLPYICKCKVLGSEALRTD